MIQKKFLCRDIGAAKDSIPEIKRILTETPYKAAVLTFYETGLTKQEVEGFVEDIKEIGADDLKIAGISIAVIAELAPEGTGILINLILTEEADIEVVTLPCEPGGEEEAAAKLRGRLDDKSDAKVVELFVSNMELFTTRFIEKSMEGHEDAVLFGTATIRNLPTKLSVENGEQVIEKEEDVSQLRDELIVGDSILQDGFVAVIFSGENLHVQANYALGWSPIGRRLRPELGERALKGETVITKLNSNTAVDIYREYLGVYPDSYFISNICEFPFIVERDGISICLIPIDCGRDGELYFMMNVHDGEDLRFSFASHDEVMAASWDSLCTMERFQPDALFLTLCGNRLNFLKEDAHLEWDGFKKASPDLALMHGACELFYHEGKGGILNSAHLAIGMREGEPKDDDREYHHRDIESLRHGRNIPLSDRMSAFLRKTTSELQEVATKAKDASNSKSAFLSHMSHEIRTPINAILGMDEMILRESGEEDILHYAEDIRSAGNNLLGIVNDVLDFSKIEAGKINIIPVEYDPASVINDLYNVVWLRAENKGLSVKLDIDPSIPSMLYGDETRVKQIITNLLTNAVKYTESGTITLTMRRLTEVGPQDREAMALSCPGEQCPENAVRLRVTVKDTGIGIRPEDMERLFNEYERVEERRNRTIEGTGLGLNITRELLELMGSRLFVESTYGEGSEFGFELVQGVLKDDPIGEYDRKFRNTGKRQYHVRFTAEDAHILVVDDNRVNLDVIRNLLKKTRIAIDTAESGEKALELVRENAYDVIFLDHLMKGMDGPETLKKMKEMEDNLSQATPVIALTANAMSGAREEYMRAGFKDYLSKPINSKKLEDMLFNYISPEKVRTVSDEDDKRKRDLSSLLPTWLVKSNVIDAAEGLKNCSTEDVYMIVLETFREVIGENADEIEDYYQKEDWENYTVKVHALKSSAKTIGAMAVSEQAALLEKAGSEGDIVTIQRDTHKLLDDYRSLLEELAPLDK